MTAHDLAERYLSGAQTGERLQKLKAACERFAVPFAQVAPLLKPPDNEGIDPGGPDTWLERVLA